MTADDWQARALAAEATLEACLIAMRRRMAFGCESQCASRCTAHDPAPCDCGHVAMTVAEAAARDFVAHNTPPTPPAPVAALVRAARALVTVVRGHEATVCPSVADGPLIEATDTLAALLDAPPWRGIR